MLGSEQGGGIGGDGVAHLGRGGGDREALGEGGQLLGAAHLGLLGVDSLQRAGDERAERRQAHLVGIGEQALLAPAEVEDAERGARRVEQRHRGHRRRAVVAHIGEQIGVIALVDGGVGDRDQPSVARRFVRGRWVSRGASGWASLTTAPPSAGAVRRSAPSTNASAA